VLIAAGRLVLGHGADCGVWQQLAAAAPGRRVEVDLSAVTDIDAAGVGVVVRLARQAQCSGRDLSIVSAGPRVRRVIEVARLDAALRLAVVRTHSDGAPPEPHLVWPRCPDTTELVLAAL